MSVVSRSSARLTSAPATSVSRLEHTNNYAVTADDLRRCARAHSPSGPPTSRYALDSGIITRHVTFRKNQHGPILGMRGDRVLAVRAVAAERRSDGAALGDGARAATFANSRRRWRTSRSLAPTPSTRTARAHLVSPRQRHPASAMPPANGRGCINSLNYRKCSTRRSGWLQNCNSTPFLTTEGLENPKASDYPAYMAPEPDTERSKRSRAILAGTHRFTFAEWDRGGVQYEVGLAAQKIPELLKLPRPATLADLIAELRALGLRWRASIRSRPRCSSAWQRARHDGGARTHQRRRSRRVGEPGGFRGERSIACSAYTPAAPKSLTSDAKPSVPVPWSAQLRRSDLHLRIARSPGSEAKYGTVGDTYVSVVDFAKTPVARIAAGERRKRRPKSKHFTDQAPLYSKGEFKDAWFYEECGPHVTPNEPFSRSATPSGKRDPIRESPALASAPVSRWGTY